MLDLIGDCFGEKLKSAAWQTKLKEMIPSHVESMITDTALPTHQRLDARRAGVERGRGVVGDEAAS